MISPLVEAIRVFLLERVFTGIPGMSLGDLRSTLRQQPGAVAPAYWLRLAFMVGAASVTTLVRWHEDRVYREALHEMSLTAPTFILGHWRSGTTHLHNLLGVDRRFAYPTAYQVLNPHTCLSTARLAWIAGVFSPRTRVVDSVSLSFEAPLEDELALCAASLLSPYLSWVFPGSEDRYDRYLTFRGVPAAEVARWKETLLLFLRKLSWHDDRPLLLKSPPHTARIRLLLELFPEARFVHIYRDPFVVFQSTRRLNEFMYRACRLRHGDPADLDDRILRRYQTMYDVFFEERTLIPPGRFHELAFEALERDPLGELARLYETLGLPDFAEVRPSLERYVASLAGYRKNQHPEIPAPLRGRISQAWRRSFDEWRYAYES